MFNTKKQKIVSISILSLAVIIVLGIVYAAFTQSLNISGTGKVRSSKWDIHFANFTNATPQGSTAIELTSPTVTGTSISNYEVSLTTPGDKFIYTFDVVNDGDYAAVIDTNGVSFETLTVEGSGDNKTTDEDNLREYISYTLKYAGTNNNVASGDTLASKETKHMVLTLEYSANIPADKLPKGDISVSGLGITLTYIQDGNAKVNPNGSTPYIDPYDYHIGDTFTLNGDSYHVIANSETASDYVVALKDTPLTASEINTYGTGHVNMYQPTSASYYQQAYDNSGVGGMAYYSTETCGYNGSDWVTSGCSTSYESSDVKRVVDGWTQAKFTNSELKTVDGYAARLINLDKENMESLGYEWGNTTPSDMGWVKTSSVPSWFYSPNYSYWYWTMSQWNDSSESVWSVDFGGDLTSHYVYYNGGGHDNGAVRPVINVYKSKIS